MRYLTTLFSRSRLMTILLAGALLGACGTTATQSPGVPQPTVAPQPTAVSQPTAIPQPTAVPQLTAIPQPTAVPQPTVAPNPTAEPAPAGSLPAPLYLLSSGPEDNGQITRLERDGKTRTKLTDEHADRPDSLAVVEFDVSPVDGSLTYIVQGPQGGILVQTDADGQNRKELLSGAASTPRWSPDGTQIAVRVWGSPMVESQGLAEGTYLIPAGGGEPKLLQADDPITDPANPPMEARGFMPTAWSPDGKYLLLNGFSKTVEICGLAVKELASGKLIELAAPNELRVSCGADAWSADSSAVYVNMTRSAVAPPIPGLWRANPATGETSVYISGSPAEGQFTLVEGVSAGADGYVYGFTALTDNLPEPFSGEDQPKYMMYQVSVDGEWGQPLSEEDYTLIDRPLWAPDHSGALVNTMLDQSGHSTLLWLPADGGPALEIAQDIGTLNVRWGHE